MLQYDRIDSSEGIDVNKTNLSKECELCHYWFFKDVGLKYEKYLCNGCHNLMQKVMDFNPIQDGLFRGYSRMGEAFGPPPPSLKSATHILQ